MANSSVVGLLKVLLTADTAQFEKGLTGADASVVRLANTMKRDLVPSQTAVNKLVRNFLGTKEIGDAREYAIAVHKIGGAANLTAADQVKVNRAVSDAILHYRTIGKEAPQWMKKLAADTKQVQIQTDNLSTTMATMKGVLGAFGIQLGLSSLVNFGKSAVAAAGQIVDLSAKTGLSIKAVQLYGAVAKQTGGDIDTYADSIFKMGINIANGGEKVDAAIRSLGLGVKELRSAGSEEQFEALAAKLQGIGNDGERNRLGVLLFGKTWKDVAPGVVQGIDAIKRATKIASDEAVLAVDAYADAVDQFLTNLEARTVNLIGKFLIRAKQTQGYQAMLGPLGFLMPEIGGALGQDVPLADVPAAPGKSKPKPSPPTIDRVLARQLNELQAVALAWSRQGVDKEIAKWLAQAKQFEKDGLTPTTEAIRKVTLQVDEWLRAGFEVPDMLMRVRDENIELVASIFPVGKGLDGLTLSARNYVNEMRKVGDAQKPFSAAVKQFADLVNKSKTMSLFSGGISGIDVAATGDIERTKAAERVKAVEALNQKFKITADLMAVAAQNGTGLFRVIVGGAQQAVSMVGQYVVAMKNAKTAADAMAVSAQLAWGAATLGLSFIVSGIANVFAEEAASAKAGAAALRDLQNEIKDLGAVAITTTEYTQALAEAGVTAFRGWVSGNSFMSILRKQRDALISAQEEMRGLTAVTQLFGGVAPKAIHGLVKELLTSKHLTAAMRKELEAMTGAPTWQVMQERAEKLGIAFSALGSTFSQARISDIALQYARDLTMFSDQGADMTAVITGMADELSTLAQEALKTGAALPKTLEAYFLRLSEMGLLLDENGNKIDMGALSFKDIEDEALKQMVSFLEEIRDLLKEIGRISLPVPTVPSGRWGRSGQGDGSAVPGRTGFGWTSGEVDGWSVPELPSFAGGTHGAYMDFGPGTPVMLHGQERVSTRGEAGSGGTFNIYAIDAPSFETFLKQRGGAEAVVRSLPPVVERWGGAR